jgi:hypothetical protein
MGTRQDLATPDDGNDRHQLGEGRSLHEQAHAGMTSVVLVSGRGRPSRQDPGAKHRTAVATTLGWADAAALEGDYAEALAWLDTLDAVGEPLSSEYRAKRAAWQEARNRGRAAA